MLTFFFGGQGAWALPTKPEKGALQPVRIRVRLAEAVAKAEVRGFDLSFFEEQKRLLVRATDQLSRWEFRCQEGRIRATPVTAQGHGETLELREPATVRTPAGFLNFRGRPYREELLIYSSGSFCEVINVVDIEKYLDGLVNAEFSARWNEEAVAAQVVAARTYAYYQMLAARQAGPGKRHFDVDSTTKDQVYDGSYREDYRASRAVDKSRGLILSVGPAAPAAPLKAFYHSTCGGQTELPQNVWGAEFPGFKRPVRCGFCNPSPVFRWEVPLQGKELSGLLLRGARSDGSIPGWPVDWERVLKKGQLLDLRVAHYTPQGRVNTVRMLWADGPRSVVMVISGSRFREWVGSNRLKSGVFQLASERSASGRIWRIRGSGHGHGVGMCQWGAKIMGDKGYKTAAILKHYYPDAFLRRLW